MGTIQSRLCGARDLIVSVLVLGLFGCGEGGEPAGTGGPGEATVSAAPREGDPATVSRLAHDFMEALSARNTGRLDQLMAPHARLFSIREGESGPIYGVRTREEFLEGLAGGSADFLERIWEPVVEVSGRIGMVWAPYDFHSDGAFTHCGIDVLAFLKLEEGWRVTSVTYNVVREGCPNSPLGPPAGAEGVVGEPGL